MVIVVECFHGHIYLWRASVPEFYHGHGY